MATSKKKTVEKQSKESLPESKVTLCESIMAETEFDLRKRCGQKVNQMPRSCCCRLKPEDQHLPSLGHGSSPTLLNTATAGTGGGTLSVGTNDSFWLVGQGDASGPGSVTSWSPAIVTSEPGSWTNAGSDAPPSPPTTLPNTDWISYDSNSGDSSRGHWYYRLRFVLCDGISPKDFKLTAHVLADNKLRDIYVNGIAQGGDYSAVHFQGDPTAIELSKNWRECINTVDFRVENFGGPSGFLARIGLPKFEPQQACGKCECQMADLPELAPEICVAWGDSKCDCFETDDIEVLCITACNCFNNVTFENLTIGSITVTDEFGQPLPLLPDNSSPVEVLPYGPVCFGDLGPCGRQRDNCKSRQIVLRTRGAKPGKYRLKMNHICYNIKYSGSTEACFEFDLCKD